VEVDVAVVLFVIAQHHRVVARLEGELAGGHAPVLPGSGAGQLPGFDLFAVDVERHALGAFIRVGTIGVAQVDRIGTRFVHGQVERDTGPDLLDGVDESGAGVPVVFGVDIRTAAQGRQLGLVVAAVLGPDVSGQVVQGVPRLGAPQFQIGRASWR